MHPLLKWGTVYGEKCPGLSSLLISKLQNQGEHTHIQNHDIWFILNVRGCMEEEKHQRSG